MAGPILTPQGTLNRLRGAILWAAFPALNVTAPFLGKDGISMAPEGDATEFIDTMTGAVTSPNVYVPIRLTFELLKTQPLSALYKAQIELSTLLGDAVVNPDAATLPAYQLTNVAILNQEELRFNGSTPAFPVRCRGYWVVNASLFNL